MYSIQNEGKTLKNKIYKHMTTVGKNLYFNILDDTVDKHNDSYQSSIKMKLTDVTDSSFIEYNKESNEKGPKLKVDDLARSSKYKNIFAKGYTPNWSEEIFPVKKIKNTVP